jgi:peptidoglycan/xylan/chitin deacetylase (PgdA/CDA1 family)
MFDFKKILLISLGAAAIAVITFFVLVKLAVAPIAMANPSETASSRSEINRLPAAEMSRLQDVQDTTGVKMQAGYFAPILTFHYISTTSETGKVAIGLHFNPKEFEKVLQDLKKNNYQTVFASDIAAYLSRGERPPKNWVALTFDDGYEDFYVNALPLLKKYNDEGTIFIITAAKGPVYLTPEQLLEIDQSGLVEIGSHTVNHPLLSQISSAKKSIELGESKAWLEKLLHKNIATICYPHGDYDKEVERIAKNDGYSYGFTYNHHPLDDSSDMFAIDRASVWPGMNVIKFLQGLQERNGK